MKTFFSAARCVLLASFFCSFSAFIHTDISRDDLKKQSREVLHELLQELLAGTSQTPEAPAQAALQKISTPGTSTGVQSSDEVVLDQEIDRLTRAAGPFIVGPTAFAGEDQFYVGPTASGDDKTLTRLERDSTGFVVWTNTLTPPELTINNVSVSSNPLQNKALAHIALSGDSKLPAVALADKSTPPEYTDFDANVLDVFLLKDTDGYQLLRTQAEPPTVQIKDAGGNLITSQIVALASSPSDNYKYIFAAVPAQNYLWKTDGQSIVPDADRGIAVLKPSTNMTSLEVKNASGNATKVDLAASDGAGVLAFYAPDDAQDTRILRAFIGGDAALCWDDTLERLYVGLSDVTRGRETVITNTTSGGVCSVLMGIVNKNIADLTLSLTPAIYNVNPNLFSSDPTQDILGFYTNKTTDGVVDKYYFSHARLLGVMHSSVGTPYLIGNVWVRDEAETDIANPKVSGHVCAVPLVGSGNYAGFVASKIDHKTVLMELPKEILMRDVMAAVRYLSENLSTANLKVGAAALLVSTSVLNTMRDKIYDTIVLETSVDIPTVANAIQTALRSPTDPVISAAHSLNTSFTQNTIKYTNNFIRTIANSVAGNTTKIGDELFNTIFTALIATYTDDNTQSGLAAAIEGAIGYALGKNFSDVKTFKDATDTGIDQMAHWTSDLSDPFVKVGVDPQYLSYYDTACKIQDIKIYGDTVYASVAGARSSASHDEAGIFASTAVFDAAGQKIRAWTPWRRMIGNVDASGGFGLDMDTGRFWYLTTSDGTGSSAPEFQKAKVTKWGSGDGTTETPSLSSIIDAAFADVGGVLGMFNFGPGTQGFKEQLISSSGLDDSSSTLKSRRFPQFSMSVVTGKGYVALVDMGQLISDVFQPASGFATDITTYDSTKSPVFIFKSTDDRNRALKDLGEIVCAEVSRLPLETASTTVGKKGWLFVGGTHGVAVLAKEADRTGWETNKDGGLSGFGPSARTSSFPAGTQWKFLRLMKSKTAAGKTTYWNPFVDSDTTKNDVEVRKIVSDQTKFLYVVTSKKLFRFAMNSDLFKAGSSATEMALDAANITTISLPTDLDNGQLYDLLVVQAQTTGQAIVLLATSNGIYKGALTTEGGATWTAIKPGDNNNLTYALKFDFVSTQPGDRLIASDISTFNADGNVYVLAADKDKKFLAVYRFDVFSGTVTPFTEPYKNGNTVTPYFYKLGTLSGSTGLDTFVGPRDLAPHAKDILGSDTGFVSNVPLRPAPDKFLPTTVAGTTFNAIDLGLTIKPPLRLGKIVPEQASGALYTYGEFGVRVNKPVEPGVS